MFMIIKSHYKIKLISKEKADNCIMTAQLVSISVTEMRLPKSLASGAPSTLELNTLKPARKLIGSPNSIAE